MENKSFKTLLSIGLITLSIFLIVYSLGIYEYFISDKTLYLLIERQNSQRLMEKLHNTNTFILNNICKTIIEKPININSEITFSSDNPNSFQKNLYLKDFQIRQQIFTNPLKKYTLLSTGFFYNSNNLFKLNLIKNFKTISIGTPEIHPMYYSANLENIPAFLKRYNIPSEGFPKTLFSLDEMYGELKNYKSSGSSDILTKYIMIYVNSLENNNVKILNNQLLENSDIKGRRFLVTLSSNQFLSLLQSLLARAKDDKRLFDEISSLHSKFAWLIPIKLQKNESIELAYKDLIHKAEEVIIDKDFQMELFVDKKDNILSRKLSVLIGGENYSYEFINYDLGPKNFINLKSNIPKFSGEIRIDATREISNPSQVNILNYNYQIDYQKSQKSEPTNLTFWNYFPLKGSIKFQSTPYKKDPSGISINLSTILQQPIGESTCNKINLNLNIKIPKESTIPRPENITNFDLNKRTLLALYVESDKFMKSFKKFQQKNPEFFEFLRGF